MAECLRKVSPSQVSALFEGWQEGMLFSALEGSMGCFWALADHPFAAICEIGDFLFLAGSEEDAERLIQPFAQDGRFHILVCRSRGLHEAAGQVLKGLVKEDLRYAFHKECSFDPDHLTDLAHAHPADITFRLFDEACYHQALSQEWSRDFVSQFASAQEYLTHGIGVAAFRNGGMISGASSYIYWKNGIEIELDTREDQRRQGLACACAARLMLECLERGILPSWDAASAQSARLAEKLGFRPAGSYPVWLFNE